MRVITAASGILALAIATGAVVLHQKNTPHYALVQIQKALETRDPRLLDKHVDIESVIGSAVDDLSDLPLPEREVRRLAMDHALTVTHITNNSSLSSAEVRDIIDVRRDGTSAHARILLEEAALDTALVLTIALEKRDGEWLFVAIADLADYVRTVGELQEQRLAEERARGRDYADWAEYLEARRNSTAWAPPISVAFSAAPHPS